ncbi:MAG: hypothetical protein COB37_02125 [Kordiimonadales bacterium]|nr:MAG: hypothetical protein COB37_02125 [Kordiimonadales bacterium]
MNSLQPVRPAVVSGKVEALFEHLIYSLATGRWQASEKLPSVREAEREWSISRLTVLAAYRKLEAAGLIEARGRSGYYVISGQSLNNLSQHRDELEAIYSRVLTLVQQESSLLPSMVFKNLAAMSDIRIQQEPEIAFVECSQYQAHHHAKECESRFQFPVAAIGLDQLGENTPKKIRNLRYLITTGFHFPEAQQIAKSLDLPVINIAIEIDAAALVNSVPKAEKVCVFERDQPMGDNIHSDVSKILDRTDIELKITQNYDEDIHHYFLSNSKALALLPPRIYGCVHKKLQQDQRVIAIDYRIMENQWSGLAQALKLPADGLL